MTQITIEIHDEKTAELVLKLLTALDSVSIVQTTHSDDLGDVPTAGPDFAGIWSDMPDSMWHDLNVDHFSRIGNLTVENWLVA